jgi:hypothetical protein
MNREHKYSTSEQWRRWANLLPRLQKRRTTSKNSGTTHDEHKQQCGQSRKKELGLQGEKEQF